MAKKIDIKNMLLLVDENTRVLVIGIAIALFAFLLSVKIYNSHNRKAEESHSEIYEEARRLVVRKDIARLDNLISEYRKYFYKGAAAQALRDTVSVLAREAAVDVISIQPQQSQKIGDYTKISFKVKLKASYNQLGKFIEKLERLQHLTRTEEIIIGESPAYRGDGGAKSPLPKEETKAEASLTISAYCASS